MLAVHWSPVKNTSQILRNGISLGKGCGGLGVYCMPLSGFSKVDKWWANVFHNGWRPRTNYNGFVFRVEEDDLPATFAWRDSYIAYARIKNVRTIADIGREYRFQLARWIAPLIVEKSRDLVEFIRTHPGDPIVKERLTPQETDSFLKEKDFEHRYWIFNNLREKDIEVLDWRKPVDESESWDEDVEDWQTRSERRDREVLQRYERYEAAEEILIGKSIRKEKLEPQEADSFRKKLDLLLKIQNLGRLEGTEKDNAAEEILAEAAQRELSRAELNDPFFRKFVFDDYQLVLSRRIAPSRIIRILSGSSNSGRSRVRKFRNRDDWKE